MTHRSRSVEQQKSRGKRGRSTAGEASFRLSEYRFTVLLLACLAGMLAMPSQVLADSTAGSDAAVYTNTVTYRLSAGLPDQPDIYTDQDGNQYHLAKTGSPYLATEAEHYRRFTAVVGCGVSVDTHDAGAEAIRAVFRDEYPIDESGFSGYISLDDITVEPVYFSVCEPVERTLVIDGLPFPEVNGLPTSYIFTVADDSAIDATTQLEMQRLAVSFAVSHYDSDGRPDVFAATLTFRGLQNRLTINHYQATASYSGNVPAKDPVLSVDLTYELVAATPEVRIISAPVVAASAVEPVVAASPTPSQLPLLITAAAVIILVVLLPLLYYWLRADARLVQDTEDGTEQLLVARRLAIQSQQAIFRLPADFDLANLNASCRLLLRGRRYRSVTTIHITYQNVTLFEALPAACIELGHQLAIVSATALTDDDLMVSDNNTLATGDKPQKYQPLKMTN